MAQLNSATLTLQKIHLTRILDHINATAPIEACGLVAGIDGRSQNIFPVTNTLHSPTRFRMNPEEQLSAMLSIQKLGWELIAIYHSHPTGPPTPSPTDIAQDHYPGTIQMIFGYQAGSWNYQAYMYKNNRFLSLPVIVAE